jgi:hypothetical protein
VLPAATRSSSSCQTAAQAEAQVPAPSEHSVPQLPLDLQ